MAIFLTADSKVVVQGMTGSEGMKHTRRMLASGTSIVGGVNPKKAGTSVDGDRTAPPASGGAAGGGAAPPRVAGVGDEPRRGRQPQEGREVGRRRRHLRAGVRRRRGRHGAD